MICMPERGSVNMKSQIFDAENDNAKPPNNVADNFAQFVDIFEYLCG